MVPLPRSSTIKLFLGGHGGLGGSIAVVTSNKGKKHGHTQTRHPELIKQKFPKGFKAVKPYLRITPQPNK